MVQPHKSALLLIGMVLADQDALLTLINLCRLSHCAINQPLLVNRNITVLINILNFNSGPPCPFLNGVYQYSVVRSVSAR